MNASSSTRTRRVRPRPSADVGPTVAESEVADTEVAGVEASGAEVAGVEASGVTRTALHPLRFTGIELAKIARMPLVWGVLAVFALVNLVSGAAVPADTVALHNYASATAVTIGGKVGPEFSRKLAQVDTGTDGSGVNGTDTSDTDTSDTDTSGTDTSGTGTNDADGTTTGPVSTATPNDKDTGIAGTNGHTDADGTTTGTTADAATGAGTSDAGAAVASRGSSHVSGNPDARRHDAIVIDARIPADSTLTADELHRQLTAVTRGATNTLASYDSTTTSDAILAQVADNPAATWLMRRKYDVYRARVTHLAKTGAAMDLAAGSATRDTLLHWFSMTGYLFLETCALAVLLMALALGYERTSGTEQLLMATRVGRRLTAPKIAAGLIASTAAYLMLVTAIVVPYLMMFDVRGVWDASVSSQYDTVFGQQPFITWWDLTIGQYLFVRLALGLAITLCFALFTAALGLLVRNTFAVAGSVGVTVLVVSGIVDAAHTLGLPWLAWIGGFNPIGVLLLHERWFTELGLDAPTAFWETGVTACSIVYLAAFAALARRRFNRRDLT